MFDTLDISSSALTAQRVRLDAIAQNIANMNNTRNPRGESIPYKRRFPGFQTGHPNDPARPGVTAKIHEDSSFRVVKEQWNHPDRDADGNVKYPDIDLAIEYVNALEASRAYEANVTAMDVTKA